VQHSHRERLPHTDRHHLLRPSFTRTGGYIFRGGTQGFGDFDDEPSAEYLPAFCSVCAGARPIPVTSSSRTGRRVGFSRRWPANCGRTTCWPDSNRGLHRASGERCASIPTRSTRPCTLEFNTVAWGGRTHLLPRPLASPRWKTWENLFRHHSNPPITPQSAGVMASSSITWSVQQHGANHAFFKGANFAIIGQLCQFQATGHRMGSTPPPLLDGQGGEWKHRTVRYVPSQIVRQTCPAAGGTILCLKNPFHIVPTANIFADAARVQSKLLSTGPTPNSCFQGGKINRPLRNPVQACCSLAGRGRFLHIPALPATVPARPTSTPVFSSSTAPLRFYLRLQSFGWKLHGRDGCMREPTSILRYNSGLRGLPGRRLTATSSRRLPQKERACPQAPVSISTGPAFARGERISLSSRGVFNGRRAVGQGVSSRWTRRGWIYLQLLRT